MDIADVIAVDASTSAKEARMVAHKRHFCGVSSQKLGTSRASAPNCRPPPGPSAANWADLGRICMLRARGGLWLIFGHPGRLRAQEERRALRPRGGHPHAPSEPACGQERLRPRAGRLREG